MKRFSLIMMVLLVVGFAGCEWFESEPEKTYPCNMQVTFDHKEACTYFISFWARPCGPDIMGFEFKWDNFNSVFIPAVNGEATIEHDFWYEGFYIIDVKAVDFNGVEIAAYSEPHEIHCWSN